MLKNNHNCIKRYLNFLRTSKSDSIDYILLSQNIIDKEEKNFSIINYELEDDDVKKVLKKHSIDLEKLVYLDQPTLQEDRLELLFLIGNGIISLDMMKEHDIAYTFLKKLGEKWEIKKLVKGIYVIEKLCHTYSFDTLKKLAYTISANNDIVVDNFYYSSPTYYINTSYRGQIPDKEKNNVVFVDKKDLMIGTDIQYINDYLYFYKTDNYRRFCEVGRKIINNKSESLMTLCDSDDMRELCRIINHHNRVFDDNTTCHYENDFSEKQLQKTAKQLGIEKEVMDLYKFITTFYNYFEYEINEK